MQSNFPLSGCVVCRIPQRTDCATTTSIVEDEQHISINTLKMLDKEGSWIKINEHIIRNLNIARLIVRQRLIKSCVNNRFEADDKVVDIGRRFEQLLRSPISKDGVN